MADAENRTQIEVHEGTAQPQDHPHPTDPEGEKKLWEWLEELSVEADRVRREEANFDDFDKWMDLYYGKHWPSTMPSFRPPVVINELRKLILEEANDLSENMLRVFVMKDPKDGGRNEEAERALRALWVREQIDLKLTTAAIWALILGTGFLRVQWDPDAFGGLGDVTVSDLDPRYVIPDPDAINDKDWAYCIIESVMDIREIRRLFPVSGMRVTPDNKWSVQDRRKTAPDAISWGNYEGPMSDSNSLVGRAIQGYKKARARVLDCLIRDDSTETSIEQVKDANDKPIKGENGAPKLEQVTKPKYPNGRRIIGANGVILFDGPNPNPSGDFGIIRVVLEPTLDRFWGKGFCEQTGELQMAADKLMSAVVENAIRLNNGIVKATTNTGVDWESFAGIPGQIVQINPGSTFDIMYPKPMPTDMVQAPDRMLDMQKRLLGFGGARSGAGGRGNVSAELTETEISQAQGATRLRARMLYYTVQRLAEMIFARMASGYMTKRVIPAVDGESFKPVTWTPVDKPEQYQLLVDPSSFQVMSRTMLKRLAMALYKLKAIDRKALLERIEWPGWEQVSERLDKQEQQAMMAKMMSKKGGK